MKTMNREEAILAMLDGKKITSDEFKNPDIDYCIYEKNSFYPFRYINNTENIPMEICWNVKIWRERKYIPKDKELVWAWYDKDIGVAYLRYYDAINNNTFDSLGDRDGIIYDNYTPFNGTPPPNICSIQDLKD